MKEGYKTDTHCYFYTSDYSLRLSSEQVIELFLDANKGNINSPAIPKIPKTCSWCGGDHEVKDKGNLSIKVIHDGCYENVLNGGGLF